MVAPVQAMTLGGSANLASVNTNLLPSQLHNALQAAGNLNDLRDLHELVRITPQLAALVADGRTGKAFTKLLSFAARNQAEEAALEHAEQLSARFSQTMAPSP